MLAFAADYVRIEGPSGGLISPQGHPVLLYSGGCYFGEYATAALMFFFHARFGLPGAERQMAAARLEWIDPRTPRCERPR